MSFDDSEFFRFSAELKKSICGDKNKKIKALKKSTNTRITHTSAPDANTISLRIVGEGKSVQKVVTKLKQAEVNARRHYRKTNSNRILASLSSTNLPDQEEKQREQREEREKQPEEQNQQIDEEEEEDDDGDEEEDDEEEEEEDEEEEEGEEQEQDEREGEEEDNNNINDNKNSTTVGANNQNDGDNNENDSNTNKTSFEIIIQDNETKKLDKSCDNCCKMLEDIMNDDNIINDLASIDQKTRKDSKIEQVVIETPLFGASDQYLEENDKITPPSSSKSNFIFKIIGAGLIIAGLAYYYRVDLKNIQKTKINRQK